MLERFRDDDGFTGYRSPLLDELGVPHLFTTRIGGARRDDLDLGALDRTALERVLRAARAPLARLATVKQVHGASVVVLGALPAAPPRADALVSARSDLLLCIHVADCVPVLMASADGRRVAAVHAGWRGLVAGVIPRALAELEGSEIVAAIGPCISCERYEVGPEVAQAFAQAGLAAAVHERLPARPRVDLRGAAELQLRAAGVRRIDSTDRCTHRDAEEFFSHRRDVTHGALASTGRLGALIGAACSPV